jgi:hypothetical protein
MTRVTPDDIDSVYLLHARRARGVIGSGVTRCHHELGINRVFV